jgi:photosystem II stability/assembly factor-like uncharacterized protein
VATPSPSVATPTATPYPSVSAISAPSADVVWVVTDDARLFRSTDQGDVWEERTMLAHPPIGHGSISFANDQDGWFLNGFPPGTQCQQQGFELWHTTDGATTWGLLAQGTPLGPGANGISFGQCKGALSFVDPLRGVLPAMDTTTPPTIYLTGDGGQSWSGQRIPDPPGFTTSGGGNALQPGRASWFGSTLLFDAVTYVEGKPNRHVFLSNDSGKTWDQVRIVTDAMPPIVFVTPVRWLRFSGTPALETIDQGLTWHAYATDFRQGAAPVTPNVVFASPSVGYAAVRFSLQRSLDGGAHWTALRMPGV